jgi:hypothetical protein
MRLSFLAPSAKVAKPVLTTALVNIVKLASTIGTLCTSNLIMDLAVGNHYSYPDYQMLCKCLDRIPETEKAYANKVQEHSQLSLMEIY